MTITCLDAEWTVTNKIWKSRTSGKEVAYRDGTPYESNNRLVSVGYSTSDGECEYLFFNHRDLSDDFDSRDSCKKLQEVLDRTELLVIFNATSDLSWLLATGFKYEGRIFDPRGFEYINNYGMKQPTSLKAIITKYGIGHKEDVISQYFEKGYNTDEIPIDVLEEYGRNDVEVLVKLFDLQKELFKDNSKIKSTLPALRLTNDAIPVLVNMTSNSIKIDTKRLLEIEKDYRRELSETDVELHKNCKILIGDYPINLESPEQLSWLFYGFKVNNKKDWVDIFNLGDEIRNGVKKKKYPTRMSDRQLFRTIKENTSVIYKTGAEQCPTCRGVGTIPKINKDGKPAKRPMICKTCNKSGIVYNNSDRCAGLGLVPISSEYASIGGFKTDKHVIDTYLTYPELSKEARNFLTLLQRRNAISMYLSTFIEGIQKYLHKGYLYIDYNIFETATGRLSSKFHNLPKGNKFPVKSCIVSKYDNGKIVNVDFGQLEWRVAAILSNDKVAIADINNNVDVHTNAANTLTEAGQLTSRDEAKSRSFKPLYGGYKGTPAEQAYFDWFLDRYSGIRDWQIELGDLALTRKWTQSPSGRIYAYPTTVRYNNGKVSNFTQIANYQIQGFGSDLVLTALIALYKALKHTKTKMIITIHDSCVFDVPPEEIKETIIIIKNTLDNLDKEIYDRFGINIPIKLTYDISIGDNWLDQDKLNI